MSKIKVIIPAYNEEKAIAHVIKEIPIQLVKLLLFLTTQLIILLK
jgi:glycosyltransferase involved in cell wall biosynthesis